MEFNIALNAVEDAVKTLSLTAHSLNESRELEIKALSERILYLEQKLQEQEKAVKRGTTVDGRHFFKLARAALTYDEFTALISNVKLFNSRQQSKQKTLNILETLFGDKNTHLFTIFERIVNQ